VFDRYSILEILAADVCCVNLFRSILPAVPTECDVLIVSRQHNDKEWKFKEQHAKMWENILVAKRYSPLPWFQHCGGERRRRLRRSDASATYGPITIAIRARFEYDSSAIQHPTRSYVLSSNNEHVNSFAML